MPCAHQQVADLCQQQLAHDQNHKLVRKENQNRESCASLGAQPRGGQHLAYPDSTPRTRLRTKKDPMMMRGMKYSQFQVAPKASLVWRGKKTQL